MKKIVLLSIILMPLSMMACSGTNPGESSTLMESSFVDPFVPTDIGEKMKASDGLSLMEEIAEHNVDYSTVSSACLNVVYGATYNNYKNESGYLTGHYEYQNIASFDKSQQKLRIEYNYELDEKLVSGSGNEQSVKGNTSQVVSFWIDGDKGYESYYKYSSEGTESKKYYVSTGEDKDDLKDAIEFATCSGLMNKQIDSMANGLSLVEDNAKNVEYYTDGGKGNIYVTWDYGDYHMELQSVDYKMVYELVESKEQTKTTYYKFRYSYDGKYSIEVPKLDNTWELGQD